MNKMKEVAKMLGLDIDEEFDIMMRENEPSNYNPFKIRERGLIDKDGLLANDYLNNLLIGNFEIIKKAWKPKRNEFYYIILMDGSVGKTFNNGQLIDAGLITLGNFFKTREEAEFHKDEMVAKMKEVLE